MAKKRWLFVKAIMVLLAVTLVLPNFCVLAEATDMEAMGITTYVEKGVVKKGLNFREGPSLEAEIKFVLQAGIEVEILELGDSWYKIMYKDEVGYVASQYIDLCYYDATITASNLNLRSSPGTDGRVIGTLVKATKVSILGEVVIQDEENPVWFKVACGEKTGYVTKRYVNILTAQNEHRRVGQVVPGVALNMRADSTTSSNIIDILYQGTYVVILGEKKTDGYYKEWYKVLYDDRIGWVAGKYIEEREWTLGFEASTKNSSSSSNRNHNMSLASKTLTGTVVLPGETFSWVQTMGSCSEEKGFKLATVFMNKQKVQGYGGGVCQVSTTINMAVKKTGIATNASTHSMRVSYASIQDEASVSYPYLDFSFKNTLESPILIELVASSGRVTCKIYIVE